MKGRILFTDRVGVRGSAFTVFAALPFTALALMAEITALGAIGYPDLNQGYSSTLAIFSIVTIIFASQVALITGALAGVHTLYLRRQRPLPTVDSEIIRERAHTSATAGLLTTAAWLLYTANFVNILPAWWLTMTAVLTLIAVALLTTAQRKLGSRTLVRDDGVVANRLLRYLRQWPIPLSVVTVIIGAAACTVLGWHAERSLMEGAERGVLEAVALLIGCALLTRGGRKHLPLSS